MHAVLVYGYDIENIIVSDPRMGGPRRKIVYDDFMSKVRLGSEELMIPYSGKAWEEIPEFSSAGLAVAFMIPLAVALYATRPRHGIQWSRNLLCDHRSHIHNHSIPTP